MCKEGECLECMTIERNQLNDYLGKIASFLIDSLNTDDMTHEEIPDYVFSVVNSLKARVKQAEEIWQKNESRAAHMSSALVTCVMFLSNVNTITEEKQVELIKSLRMAGLVDLADSVAAGGFASVFEGAE